MSRPKLTLENEITNHFCHLIQTSGGVHMVPSDLKKIMLELRTLYFAKGKLSLLKENEKTIQDSLKEIEDLDKFIGEEEAKLILRYRHDEIKGT